MWKSLSLFMLVIALGCGAPKDNKTENEWIKLFNGKDLNDWIVKVHHHEPAITSEILSGLKTG